jgi:hypothetical protein
MRLNEISAQQRRLLSEVSAQISGRLEAHFVELPAADDSHIGIALHQADRKVIIEVPLAILVEALDSANGREVLRTRIKARRDRMMFKGPGRAFPKDIEPLFNAGPPRNGFRGGRR